MISEVKNHLVFDTNVFRHISRTIGNDLSDIILIQRKLKKFEQQNNCCFLITYDIIQELLQHVFHGENNLVREQCQKGLALAILLCSDISDDLHYFFPKDKVIHSLPGFILAYYDNYSNNNNTYCISKLDAYYWEAIIEFLKVLEGKNDIRVSELDFSLFKSEISETRNNFVKHVVFNYLNYLVNENDILKKTYLSKSPQNNLLVNYKNEIINTWGGNFVSYLLYTLVCSSYEKSSNKTVQFFCNGVSNEYLLNFFLQDISKKDFNNINKFSLELSQKRRDRVFDYFILHSIERFNKLFYPEIYCYLISNDKEISVQPKKIDRIDSELVSKMKEWTIYYDSDIDLSRNLDKISKRLNS